MPEWSFQRKLITGVILICIVAILTSAASLVASRLLITNMHAASNGISEDLDDARALQLAGVKKIADARAFLLSGGDEFAPVVKSGGVRVRDLIARLQSRITDPEGRSLLEGVVAAENAHEAAFERALTRAASTRSKTAPLPPEPLLSRGALLDQALSDFVAHVELGRNRAASGAGTSSDTRGVLMVLITIAPIVLLVLSCLILITALSRSYRTQSTARNVAEQEQTAAQTSISELEAASRSKDEFLATVSHELRNPLAPILTWTQLLRSGTLDEAKTKRALEVIEHNVMSQSQLIDDLVDVSRVAAGKFRLDVRPIDLMPIIKAAADSQAPASDAKQIRLQLVLDERAGLISGDSERLRQVMWNVIANAIKFTPRGGKVQVVLQRSESHVEVAVSDTGIGIEAALLPHVFEPFRQASGGSTRRHGGLGLGLSIARHIMELHGGEILAFSEGPNRGSKFLMTFPLLATAPDTSATLRRHPVARDTLAVIELGRLDGVRVLIVDDEPSASEALMVLFNSCGAESRVAGSAVEALIVFDEWRPDVLVSDIAMPGEDGYSLIKRIRSRAADRGGHVPAVALTAYAKIEDRVTILGAGFQMYLSKPSDPNELVAVVASLAKKRGTDEVKLPV